MLERQAALYAHRGGFITDKQLKINKHRHDKLSYAVKHWRDDTNIKLKGVSIPSTDEHIAKMRDMERQKLAIRFAFLDE